ncbi:MAG: amidohydrolase family protein [Dehalococcoidia bacterium]
MTLVIRNARLRRRTDPVAIVVEDDGTIATVGDGAPPRSERDFDAEGRLVLPAFVDAHIHLDKALLGATMRPNVSQTLQEAVEITNEFARNYRAEEICARAVHVMREAVRYGTLTQRVFVDTYTVGGLVPLEGLFLAREVMKDLLDIQIIALPQESLLSDPAPVALLEQALRQGADIVGGNPSYESSAADSRKHIELCFELAERFNRPIHMIVDPTEDPKSRCLEYLAAETMRRPGFAGRVAASWDALVTYDDAYAARVIEMLKQADVAIVCNSHVNLLFNGRSDRHPIRRGGTRWQELLAAGVNVAAGQDDVNDPYYPFGKADALEVAFMLCHMAHFASPAEMETAIDMITVNPARALGLTGYGIEPGSRADLVVVDAPNVHEALRTRADRRAVFRAGQLVAELGGGTKLLA